MDGEIKKGIIKVLIANIINMVFNLLTSFILPKYLSVDSYAAVKTFQLYSSYTGLLSLGYLDGIYLKYGGKQINSIDSKELQITISTARIFQFIITILVVFIGILFENKILIAFGASVLPVNMAYYYKNLYQAVGEFGKYGKILNVTAGVTFATNAILLFIIKTDYYVLYLAAYVVVYYLIWFVMEFTSIRDRSAKLDIFIFSFNELVNNTKSGILLLLGNLSSVLMTSLDRWCIKALMDNLAFAQYSFAVSIEGFMNLAVSPVTVTLYNYFCKDHSKSELIRIRNCVMIFASTIVACAFPARFILETYLTNYLDSTNVMFLLFAAQIFYIISKSIFVNLYKAYKKQKLYFIKLVAVIIIGFVFNLLFYWLLHIKESFAIGTLLSAISWYFLCIFDFKDLKYRVKEFLYPFLECLFFLLCGFSFNSIIGFCVYFILTIILSKLFLSDDFDYLAKQGIKIIQKYKKK